VRVFDDDATNTVSSRARPGIHPEVFEWCAGDRSDNLAAVEESRDGSRLKAGMTLGVGWWLLPHPPRVTLGLASRALYLRGARKVQNPRVKPEGDAQVWG
jgi:hypothetical protein